MEDKLKQIIEIIEASNLKDQDKSFLLEKINDESISLVEKERLLAEYIHDKENELIVKLGDEAKPILEKGDDELAQAEKEYNETMNQLEEESKKLEESEK